MINHGWTRRNTDKERETRIKLIITNWERIFNRKEHREGAELTANHAKYANNEATKERRGISDSFGETPKVTGGTPALPGRAL